MLYEHLAGTYLELEEHSSRLAKISIVAELIRDAPDDILSDLVLLVRGKIFPPWSTKELEFGMNYLMEAIRKATGSGKKELVERIKELGDIGEAAGWAVAHRKQQLLQTESLKVEDVVKNLRRISGISGEGTVEKKVGLVAELFAKAGPLEAKYLARTIMEKLRIGVGEGVVRDAIGEAYDVESSELDHAYALTNDFGKLAELLREEGPGALSELSMEVGSPIKVMLAQKTSTLEEGLEAVGGTGALEYKFDGFRIQIHKRGDEVMLFTRRLEEVTDQFPDIVQAARDCLNGDELICEGEVIGIDRETGDWLPFQKISRRIRRKYDIGKVSEKIPVVTHLFDLIYLNGEELMSEPFRKRRRLLEGVVGESEVIVIADQLVTDDSSKGLEFYEHSLSLGNEGIMIKNLDSPYQPGSRVGHMLKLKPIMETLDLVIIGAEWGVGRRSGWFGSFILGARDPDKGTFPEVGRMATGLTDEEFKKMTRLLKPLVTEEIGKVVAVKPKLVVEVGYEEIQESPKYPSGYALRFPRLVRFRDDKSPEDADTLERIEGLFEKQRHRK